MNEREILLSDEAIQSALDSREQICDPAILHTEWFQARMLGHAFGMQEARSFYENLISQGRLREVKKVTDISDEAYCFRCSDCLETWDEGRQRFYHCPGCGNPIERRP